MTAARQPTDPDRVLALMHRLLLQLQLELAAPGPALANQRVVLEALARTARSVLAASDPKGRLFFRRHLYNHRNPLAANGADHHHVGGMAEARRIVAREASQ